MNKDNIKTLIKIYYPDLLLQLGVFIFSLNFFTRCEESHSGFDLPNLCIGDRIDEPSIFGIMLITVALNVFVRRYFSKNKHA